MEFVDHTGHIFSITSYPSNPIGSEYKLNPYIFWLEDEYNGKLSVNNYYILPIRFLVPHNIQNIKINVEGSDFYYLLSSKDVHKLVNGLDNLNDYIKIKEEEDFDIELTEEDLVAINISDTHYLVPFYVIGMSPVEGTMVTNILIQTTFDNGDSEWCSISVGGIYYDEYEMLITDASNMGVRLPKDILKAIYQYSYHNEVPDEVLYANKIKEYLMNYMHIKGQIGNFNSVLDSLKWFGYGDRIEIQKLLQTDNQFQDQFFLDDFTITTDLLHSYKAFRASTYISLRLWDNVELPEVEDQISKIDDFYGEGKPYFEDLFSKIIVKHYDEGDLDFYRSYYDYAFDELGLKLAVLDYYFKKYFLPIHLHIHSTTISHQVFANDIKMINMATTHEQEKSVLVSGNKVKFKDVTNYYIYNQKFYTDSNFNNLAIYHQTPGQDQIYKSSYYKEIGEYVDDYIYYINEPCISIPIEFIDENEEGDFYNCHLLLIKDDKLVFESNFQFAQSKEIRYDSFVILPKYINKYEEGNQLYWLDSTYKIALLVNDNWYYHKFNIRVPEMDIAIGRLEYRYSTNLDNITRLDLKDATPEQQHDYGFEYDRENHGEDIPDIDIRYLLGDEFSLHTQLNTLSDGKIDFNSFMYTPSLVEVNDIKFYDKLYGMIDNIMGEDYLQDDRFVTDKSQTGLLTKQKLYNKIKQKCILTNFSNDGILMNKPQDREIRKVDEGYQIIPKFYFNDFTRDDNQEWIDKNYKIKDYFVDIYFGLLGNNDYVAKTTKYLVQDGIYNDELLGNDPYGLVEGIKLRLDEWNDVFAGDNNDYAILQDCYKEELEGVENSLEIELPFKITRCLLSKFNSLKKFQVRFVWNIMLEGEETFISSYDTITGNPRDGFYEDFCYDIREENKCKETDCFVLRHGLTCKFKEMQEDTSFDIKVDYTDIKHEYQGNNVIQEEQEELIEESLNKTIKGAENTVIIANNDALLNRIHIYNIYHTGYKGKIDKLTRQDIYEEFNTDEVAAEYFSSDIESRLFETNVSDLIPLKYNKEKYGDYKISMVEYNKNKSTYEKNLYRLYKLFFTEGTAEQLVEYPTKHSNYDYDFYLMHDDTNWYVVFISQLPISYSSKGDLDAPKEISYIDIHGHEFLLKHYRSGNNFLINRMYFNETDGKNIFSPDDLIVAQVKNVNFPVILDKDAKWRITPISLGIDKENSTSYSNANTCIFNIGTKNTGYSKGYYKIDVRYSIDGDINHQQFVEKRILVKD